MKPLSKVILILFACLALLAVGGVVAARSYLQSDDGRARLQEGLSKAIKLPIKLRRVAIEFPANIRAEEIATGSLGVEGEPVITAKSLHGRLALRPLLSGDFDFHDVVLDSPTLVWPQNKEGRWAWPSPEKVKTEPKEPKVVKAPSEPRKRSAVVFRGIKLQHGTITLTDAQQQPVIAASDVTTNFTEISSEQLVGTLTAGRLVWNTKFVFENVTSSVRYAHDNLELDRFQSDTFGGTVKGRLEMDTRTEGQPFKTHVEMGNVDLNGLAMASGWTDGEVSGRLSGNADLAGRSDRLARIEGPGQVTIENGRFKKLELFEAIAYALDLSDLANLRPKEATGQFNVKDEKMFIDSLVLATDNLRIEAHGVAKFDGKLGLDARLSVTDRFAMTLPEFARGSFAKGPDGKYGLDFKITGKTDKPKTDLAEKLIGGKVQDKVVDLLGGLFGTKPPKKEKHDKKEGDKKEGDKKEGDKAAPTGEPQNP